jgi:hypothetical protein
MNFFLTNLVLFCISGQVPSLEEANKNEGIITLPWAQEKPLELGIFLTGIFLFHLISSEYHSV